MLHKEENQARDRQWYQENKERIAERRNSLEGQEHARQSEKRWRTNNPEKRKLSAQKYRKNHPDFFKDYLNADPLHRLAHNLRTRLTYALKQKSFDKTARLDEYLGCTVLELKEYLEKKFQSGMNWSNYGNKKGDWEIDHIIPLSLATTPEEMYRLCHYLNLQPLWRHNNRQKHNKDTRSRE
jgi:hypothetical protein